MFSKINFTYKKPSQNSQSYLILKEQLVKQKIRENEKKSLINCINLQNKVDSKKVQNTSDTFEQSREKIVNDTNKNIEIKLGDSSSINTEMIDNVKKPEIILLTDEQIHVIEENIKNSQTSLHNKADPNKIQNTRDIFEQSIEKIDYTLTYNNIIEIKLNDASSINTGIINDVNKSETPLTEEQIKQIQAMKDKYINDLREPVEEGNFDVEKSFSFIEQSSENNIDPEMYDNIPLPFNVGRIHKRGIRIINNVYQSKYAFGKENSTGLGDFLRGCYFILEFCERNRLN